MESYVSESQNHGTHALLMQNHANSYSNWPTQELKTTPLIHVILFQDANV